MELKLIFHGVVLSNYLYGMYYDLNCVELPEPFKTMIEGTGVALKGRMAFLTFLNMVSVID